MVWRKSLRRVDPLWESGSPAIWRAAAVIQAPRFFFSKKCAGRSTTAVLAVPLIYPTFFIFPADPPG
jgi:hypothetical protein